MNNEDSSEKEAFLNKSKNTLGLSLLAGHWSVVNTISQKFFGYGTFFITARLLTPADFGLIAIAAIIPNLIDACTSLSFENALIQKKDGEEKKYLNAIWTFNVIRSILLFAVVILLGPLFASFFHAEEATLLFQMSGFLLFIPGWSNIGQIYFFKNLDFKKVFLRDLSGSATSFFVSVGGAMLFHTYWALFLASVLSVTMNIGSTYLLNDYRPHFDFKFRKLRELLPYSQWIFGQQLFGQLARTLEDSIVARFTDPTSVGLFTKAKGLANAPTSPVVSLINKISFAAYSRVQESLAHVREGWSKSFEVIFVVAFPFLVAILVAGDRLVLILLGDKWIAIAENLKILTIAATIDILTVTLTAPVLNALGKPRIQFTAGVLYVIVLITALLFLTPLYGITGAAYAMAASSLIAGAYSVFHLHRLVQLSLPKIAETVLSVVIATAAPLLFALLFLRFPLFNTTLGFLFLGGVISLGYLYTMYLTYRFAKKGPYPTLRIIGMSFVDRFKMRFSFLR